MPAPLDPTHREAIAASIRTGNGTASCRGIAAEHHVSPSTVRAIAKEIGLPDAFARADTKNATRAAAADAASRRAALATTMLDLAERIAKRAREPYTVIVATKDDVFREVLDEPPLDQVRQAMTALGIAVDKHIALIRFDSTGDDASGEARSLLSAVAAGLQGAYEQITGGDPS